MRFCRSRRRSLNWRGTAATNFECRNLGAAGATLHCAHVRAGRLKPALFLRSQLAFSVLASTCLLASLLCQMNAFLEHLTGLHDRRVRSGSLSTFVTVGSRRLIHNCSHRVRLPVHHLHRSLCACGVFVQDRVLEPGAVAPLPVPVPVAAPLQQPLISSSGSEAFVDGGMKCM